MQKNITIDGQEVLMEANGATPRVYRQMFGKDLLVTIRSAIGKTGEVNDIEVFENLAFCMAKQAGSVEGDIDAWLAGFDSSTAILDIIPDLMMLWRGNEKTSVAPKKKASQQTGK